MENTYEDFRKGILRITGIDLSLYQEKQMKRRIDTHIARLGFDGYERYFRSLEDFPESRNEFISYITISVTEFFRTPGEWEEMEDIALRDLFGKKDSIRVWSMACSSGEEPYSLVMSVREKFPGKDISVYATDIDESILSRAIRGEYAVTEMKNVSETLRDRYFTFNGSAYRIRDGIKEKVMFEKRNLLRYDYPNNFDLILARNVLIYFTKEAKSRIFREIRESLLPGGYLFTGNTEQIVYYKDFGFQRVKPFLYRRPGEER